MIPRIRPEYRNSQQSATAAAGEAMVWLTASMLLVCLAAIFGLLMFILYCGLPAFWPSQIDLVATNEGQIELGQRILSRGDSVSYRIGNADRSTSPVQNFSRDIIPPSSVGQPQNAAKIERSRWDPLYGIPLQVTQAVLLPQSHYQTLLPLSRFSMEEATEETAAALPGISEEDRTRLNNLHEQLTNLALRQQLALRAADVLMGRVVNTAQWIALDNGTAESRIAIMDARWVWTDANTIPKVLKLLLAEQKKVAHKVQELEELLRLHEAEGRQLLEQLTAFSSNSSIPYDVQSFSAEVDALAQREFDLLNPEQLLSLLQSLDSNNLSLDTSLWALIERVTNSIRVQNESKRSALLQQLSDVASSAGDTVVQRLFDHYHANAKARLQVNKELELYSLRQSAASLSLALTGNSQPIEISQRTAEEALGGQLSLELVEALKIESDATATVVTVEKVTSNSSLIILRQQDSPKKQALSIQAANFLEPADSRTWLAQQWQQREIPISDITHFTQINSLNGLQTFGYYLDRWREFLWESPREAHSGGGIFPAIWGTVVLTLIMIVAVVPFGVIAALYLREYTGSGPLVSLVRISINNLAGVPSIIYGVFGVAFFCYTMGAFIDGGPVNADIRPMHARVWLFWLAAVLTTGIAAVACTIMYAKRVHRRQVKASLPRWTLFLWLACLGMVLLLVFKNPFFEGFFSQQLPNPTFGKGGILWAALTLALLTLPIVIVSTEEALATVPTELRDASAACGASKWQTIRRIVLPYATPGIMTGGILAMTRGVGQVAPLMLVGALPRAPDLPLDSEFPFLHISRSFMHLGYQVYAFGIQGQNTEATQPLVFACILLLVGVVALLNLTANWMRSRMRQRIRNYRL